MKNYIETACDKLNRIFRYKMINIIPVSSIFSPVNPTIIPLFSSGIFLEANELGIWISSTSDENKGKKLFFYHDKIIKIEEIESISANDCKDIKKIYDKYDEDRNNEIKDIYEDAPDVIDPSDHNRINEMIEKAQKIILENKTNDFLEKRS